jgi:hypothetical protein
MALDVTGFSISGIIFPISPVSKGFYADRIAYPIFSPMDSNFSLRYDVRNLAGKGVSLDWSVASRVESTANKSWRVLSLLNLTSSPQWQSRLRISLSKATLWGIYCTTAKYGTVPFDIRKCVGSSAKLAWSFQLFSQIYSVALQFLMNSKNNLTFQKKEIVTTFLTKRLSLSMTKKASFSLQETGVGGGS